MSKQVTSQASLAIHFLVVGGGISGLSTAIAIRRAGHHVIVLDKEREIIPSKASVGFRSPPNLSNIFLQWGLGSQLNQIAIRADALDFRLIESGEYLGHYKSSEEILKDAGGSCMLSNWGAIHSLLQRTALEYGVEFRLGSRVTSIDCHAASVTLSTGEVITGTVVVGADGATGLSRKILLAQQQAEGKVDHELIHPKFNMYSAVISKESMMQDTELRKLYDNPDRLQNIWIGDDRSTCAFISGFDSNFSIVAYGPYDTTSLEPLDKLRSLWKDCDPTLQKMVRKLNNVTCSLMENHEYLNDFISNRLVVIGNSAHPSPPGSMQEYAMGVEDGAVLARLFSHLISDDQISIFLQAFQTLRNPRRLAVYETDVKAVEYLAMKHTMEDIEQTSKMQEKKQAGINDKNESDEWTNLRVIFAYSAEDVADNWWVAWGLLRERAKGTYIKADMPRMRSRTQTELVR